jgi:hypothetical protein
MVKTFNAGSVLKLHGVEPAVKPPVVDVVHRTVDAHGADQTAGPSDHGRRHAPQFYRWAVARLAVGASLPLRDARACTGRWGGHARGYENAASFRGPGPEQRRVPGTTGVSDWSALRLTPGGPAQRSQRRVARGGWDGRSGSPIALALHALAAKPRHDRHPISEVRRPNAISDPNETGRSRRGAGCDRGVATDPLQVIAN